MVSNSNSQYDKMKSFNLVSMKVHWINSMLMIVFLLLLVNTQISAAVSGTVYEELPVNGTTANTYGFKDTNEAGLFGIEVWVYDASGLIGAGPSTTTAANGTLSYTKLCYSYAVRNDII